MTHYHHITNEERFYIWNASREGVKQNQIAKTLGRHPSSISREMKRNRMRRSVMYIHYWACELVKWRKRRVADTKHRKVTEEIGGMIELLIRQCLSPEQVCGYLKEHHSISLSHETVYRYIYEDKERHQSLKPFLRQGSKLRRKRYGSGARASKIPNRVCITDRPKIVEEKTRIGDWECDTVVGLDRKSVLITLVDRATLFTCCARVYTRKAKVVSSAIIRMLKPYTDKVKTLTFDNGSEFIEHEKIAKSLNAKTFFAHPYSSWERGINENTNGLLRQFFPKKTDFKMISNQELKYATDNLNNRPRKTRNYKTPNQLFNGYFKPLI